MLGSQQKRGVEGLSHPLGGLAARYSPGSRLDLLDCFVCLRLEVVPPVGAPEGQKMGNILVVYSTPHETTAFRKLQSSSNALVSQGDLFNQFLSFSFGK
jgi:hypothetical protein